MEWILLLYLEILPRHTYQDHFITETFNSKKHCEAAAYATKKMLPTATVTHSCVRKGLKTAPTMRDYYN